MATASQPSIGLRPASGNNLAGVRYLSRVSPSIPAVNDLAAEIRRRLDELGLAPESLTNRRIAVTAGSRGIAGLKVIVRATCDWLRERGAHPFVFPAMGSHGGATPEGQRAVLEGYGITEEYLGAPIVSSMEVVQSGQTPGGAPVYTARDAWESDGVLVVHRVKPHTNFSGKIESGILKMMAVGMGKQKGAAELHRAALKHGYEAAIREFSGAVLASGKILGAVALVENEFHQVCQMHPMQSRDLPGREEAIFEQARRLVPRIPFSSFQLLIVDALGKNISGTGMDTKVIGRGKALAPGDGPAIDFIYVRDVTAESEGNVAGVGLADLVHERIQRKADLQKTYINARTALDGRSVRMPMSMPTDAEAIDFALSTLGSPPPAAQRFVWIRNTLELNRLAISEPLVAEGAQLSGWRISPAPVDLRFDAQGDLIRPD